MDKLAYSHAVLIFFYVCLLVIKAEVTEYAYPLPHTQIGKKS